jgi:hypothetical protein
MKPNTSLPDETIQFIARIMESWDVDDMDELWNDFEQVANFSARTTKRRVLHLKPLSVHNGINNNET